MNWRLKPTARPSKEMAEWEIEPLLGVPGPNDDVVYSALGLVNDSFAVPAVVVKQLASPDWLGDMAYYIRGQWQGPHFDKSAITRFREVFVANPFEEDPSFQVATNSRQGLPVRSVLHALSGAPVYRTDRLGTVALVRSSSQFQVDGGG
ncbi:MAG TPA: hypothetical protein VM674_09260 [Candidatus Acidoferrum sp.]|nr:hypothetical protein [Candidatus Acidoferrum sp.]